MSEVADFDARAGTSQAPSVMSKVLQLGLPIVFLILSVPRVLGHAMWRDEWQAWLLARDSATLADLYYNTRFENYPLLWHTLLWILNRLGCDYVSMQLLHVTIATAAVYVVVRFAPFTAVEKLVFSFGYFPFFEYNVISRCYGLGMLLMLVAAAVLTGKKARPVAYGVTLALLAQTSCYGLMAALTLGIAGAVYYADRVRTSNLTIIGKSHWNLNWARFGIGVGIGVLGGVLALLQIRPHPEVIGDMSGDMSSVARADRVFIGIVSGFCPIPPYKSNFWNGTYVTEKLGALGPGVLLSITAALAILPFFLFRRRASLVLLVMNLLVSITMSYLYPGSIRHQGYFYLGLVVAYWIESRSFAVPMIAVGHAPLSANPNRTRILLQYAFWLLIGAHMTAGVMAAVLGSGKPLTSARELAQVIQEGYPREMPILVDIDAMGMPIGGYLNRPIYYLGREEFGSFIIEDERRRKTALTPVELDERLRRFFLSQPGDALLVTNYPASLRIKAERIGSFRDSQLPEEKYEVHVLRHP